MSHLEIESKVPLKKEEVVSLKNKIKKIAKLQKKVVKKDIYYASNSKNYPKKAVRIRSTHNSFEINFKKHLKKYYTEEVVVKEEFEFKINDKRTIGDFKELLKDMHIKKWIEKIKKNETYIHKKNKKISIEINKVENLGYYLEIEYLCQRPEMKKAIKEVEKTLEELEIQKDRVDNTGYTKLLWDKKLK